MRKKENEKYVKTGVTCLAVILIAIIVFFILEHSSEIGSFFGVVLGIVMPFIYGAVIAYILAPLCNRIEARLRRHFKGGKNWPAVLSMVLTIIIAFLVVVLLLLLVIPNVVNSIIDLINALPAQLENLVAKIHNLLEENPDLQSTVDEIISSLAAAIESWLKSDLSSSMQPVITALSGTVSAVITACKNIFLGILISVYLLAMRKKFAVQAKLILNSVFSEKWANIIEKEVRYGDRMFNGFLMGRVLDSVIVGIICFIFSLLFRFESAALIAVIVGVTNIIPVFGPFLGAIPCALLLLLENPVHCIIFIIFIILLQLVDGNLIGPRILGQTTGLNSFWVLFAVMFFGGLWGIVGMVVGVPLFAIIYDIIRQLVYYGLRKRKRTDLINPDSGECESVDAEAPQS